MTNLYLGHYIKRDKLRQALLYARHHDRLGGVEEREIDAFLEGFEKVVTERHREFQDQIDYQEMQKIIGIMSRDHTDIVNETDLRTIESVLLDKEFKF